MWCDVIKNWVLNVSVDDETENKKLKKNLHSISTELDLLDLWACVAVSVSSNCLVRAY